MGRVYVEGGLCVERVGGLAAQTAAFAVHCCDCDGLLVIDWIEYSLFGDAVSHNETFDRTIVIDRSFIRRPGEGT